MPKKQVSVSQLRFGVYIHELDRPWTETPFMFQGFVLNTEAQLNALKQYCRMVLIDTDKGMDVQDRPDPFAGKVRPPSVLDTIKETTVYEVKSPFAAEVPVARKAAVATSTMMKDMFGSIKAGKAIDAPRVKEAVTSMTDSVVRNPDTMMLLAKMKESGEHTLDRAFGVSIYMITFGRFLHLPREQLDLLGTLGLLQDVGKVRLPPDLLDKTDPLTEVELKVCKSHVRHSVAILRETVGLPPGLPELAALHPLVVSSGFHELIDPVLERESVQVELQANRIEAGPDGWRPIWRRLPVCSVCGQPCKRSSFPPNGEVVYVGDGYSDRCGALAADRVFARDGLADYLDEQGVPYERFDTLLDVAAALS